MNDSSVAGYLMLAEKYVKSSSRRFTLNDAAAGTGLRVDQIKESLNGLMEKYHCRLQLTENGDLIYDFGRSLVRRGEKTWGERWQQLGELLWKAFQFFYKIWITVTLVAYFILFVVILIALFVASISNSNDNSRGSSSSSGSSGTGNMIAILFRALFDWHTFNRTVEYTTDQHGYPYKRYQPKPSVMSKKEGAKNFVAAVYDFVFGPPRVKPDPLANAKELAAYIRQQRGVLVTSEVVALSGPPVAQAEDLFTDALVRFNGSAEVTDRAVLIGRYPELIRSLDKDEEAPIVWFWDEFEPPYLLTGNSSGDNFKVAGMNAFNLGFSIFALSEFYSKGYFFVFAGTGMEWLLGWVPLVYSLIFFAVPAVRWFVNQPKEKKRTVRNIQRQMLKQIFAQPNRDFSAEKIFEEIEKQRSNAAPFPTDTLQSIWDELVIDLGGEASVTETGQLVYRFEKLSREMAEVRQLRAQTRPDTDLGNVQFEVD